MKKLSTQNKLTNTCPHCHRQLAYLYPEKQKASGLRIAFWIVFSFALVFALGLAARIFRGEFDIFNISHWIAVGIVAIFGIILAILKIKQKRFEARLHLIVSCKKCNKTWLAD